MKIPPYWACARFEGKDRKGRSQTFAASGWSFASLQAAKDDAKARAKRIFDLITSGQTPNSYEYLDQPIREEIIQEVLTADTHVATVTRNRYGALVLNCRSVLFVDVDFPKVKGKGLVESILLAFSRKRRDNRQQTIVDDTVREVESWARENPAHSFRLYRTKEGLRLLFTDREYEPNSAETEEILAGLKADPLYVKLTRKQECFRARLTAKPWRCGMTRPPCRYPWLDDQAEASYRKWEAAYSERDAEYRTCKFLIAFGGVADSPAITTIVGLHDRMTRIEEVAPLA
jgi:hypothetical protein